MTAPTHETGQHPERGKHDKEGRRRALMEAAITVFATRGYDAATTREVADRAGCSEGLIHRYFGGKRGLLLATLAGKSQQVAEEITASALLSTSVEEEITRLLTDPLPHIMERQAFMRVVFARSVEDPEVGRTIGESINQQRVTLMAERLRMHQQEGRIRPETNVLALAEAIAAVSFAFGFISQVAFDMDPAYVLNTTLETARIICHGVLPAGAEGSSP